MFSACERRDYLVTPDQFIDDVICKNAIYKKLLFSVTEDRMNLNYRRNFSEISKIVLSVILLTQVQRLSGKGQA